LQKTGGFYAEYAACKDRYPFKKLALRTFATKWQKPKSLASAKTFTGASNKFQNVLPGLLNYCNDVTCDTAHGSASICRHAEDLPIEIGFGVPDRLPDDPESARYSGAKSLRIYRGRQKRVKRMFSFLTIRE
jgi:hypothetical protein